VSFYRPVAPLTGDCLRFERGVLVTAEGSWNRPCPPGVAKQAVWRYGSVEIRSFGILVPWRHTPVTTRKIPERRLEKMVAELDEVREGMGPRTDRVSHRVLSSDSVALQLLDHSGITGFNGKVGVRHRMCELPGRFAWGAQRMRHLRGGVSGDLSGVTLGARVIAPGWQHCGQSHRHSSSDACFPKLEPTVHEKPCLS
jgi:hypothetical protein